MRYLGVGRRELEDEARRNGGGVGNAGEDDDDDARKTKTSGVMFLSEDEESEDEDETDGDATTTTFRRVYNFTAAARGEDVDDAEGWTDTAGVGGDTAGAVATRVEITVSGVNVAGEGLNLAERVRACAHRGPPSRPLRTAASLREEELVAIARRCKEEADLPTGWYYDGAVYVSYDGLRRTSAHPRMDEYVGAKVEEMNGAIEEWNVRAEEARNALRGVTITVEEVRAYA